MSQSKLSTCAENLKHTDCDLFKKYQALLVQGLLLCVCTTVNAGA